MLFGFILALLKVAYMKAGAYAGGGGGLGG